MTIDFSKGADYWLDLIQRLLKAFSDFMDECFGIKIFAPSGNDDTTVTVEETTNA